MPPFRAAYISFDPHPCSKGASTHIEHFSKTLSATHYPLLLLTLKGDGDPIHTESIHQECFVSTSTNLLDRALAFTRWVKAHLANHYSLVLVHFRDVWGGMAALEFPHLMPVFEVNGLPSIELPYRYPMLGADTLAKIKRLEDYCLERALTIVTPSHTTAHYLTTRGVDSEKVVVIPNGAEAPEALPRRADLPEKYFAYVGALQPWQGVADLVRSLRYIEDISMPLVICCSHPEHLAKPLQRFAEELGVRERILWRYQCNRNEVNQVLQHAMFSVAPLTECSRNIEQGCSPLKILESMANGTPVIASRLPPTAEIITHGVDGILCKPGRPADLARNIRLASEDEDHLKSLGEAARKKIAASLTWQQSGEKLRCCYQSITILSY